MVLNEVPAIQSEFDAMEQAFALDRRERLLRRLGSKVQGLRCWAFGAGWETRTLAEVSLEKIVEFTAKYA